MTLGEELEFIRSYLFLHEVRLGNCLTCQNNVPAEYAEKMLPPLTLQLLVENVIKHNSITPGKPMVITIRIEDEYLSVSNPIHASEAKGRSKVAEHCYVHTSCSTNTKRNILNYLFKECEIPASILEFELVPLADKVMDSNEE